MIDLNVKLLLKNSEENFKIYRKVIFNFNHGHAKYPGGNTSY